MENIWKVLSAFNPWWSTGGVNGQLARAYKRVAYFEAMDRMRDRSIRRSVVLTGARRVGKTTIEYQMIEALLKEGVPPEKIVFISLDHPMLKLASFQDILTCYHENIMPEKDVYYFFDEIQYAQDWELWLKFLYDTQPELTIVATGSASPALARGGAESGTGRWSVVSVPTLTFYEYVELLGILPQPRNMEELAAASLQGDGAGLKRLMMALSPLQPHFLRYLQVGGFPELALAGSDILAQRIMREDVVDKVLKRDLPALYKIRNMTEMERIFLYLCSISSDIVSLEAIAKELDGVSRPTVENYIRYLESANLIYQSWPIGLAGKKILKARPKIYIADAAIRNSVLMDADSMMDPVQAGKIVETAVYKHIATYYRNRAISVGYYRDGKSQKEIDIVVEHRKGRFVFVEVKYRDQAKVLEKDAISELAGQAENAILVTKRPEDFGVFQTQSGGKLLRIPAFAFLYILGYLEKQELQEV